MDVALWRLEKALSEFPSEMCIVGNEGCHQNRRPMTIASDPWKNDRAFSAGLV